jgi:uncharacterized protein
LLEGGFCGFKPYPYLASDIKDDEISLFDCVTKPQLKVLDRHKKALLLHLPRRGRLADPDNIREILAILDAFPGITVVLAHFGRCFSLSQFEKGMELLGSAKDRVFFDTAAVADAAVYRAAFDTLDWKKIVYGSDMPIFLWHGRIDWTDAGTQIYCREDFAWNLHAEGPEEEAKYTLYMYGQIAHTVEAMRDAGANLGDFENVFYRNAVTAYKME